MPLLLLRVNLPPEMQLGRRPRKAAPLSSDASDSLILLSRQNLIQRRARGWLPGPGTPKDGRQAEDAPRFINNSLSDVRHAMQPLLQMSADIPYGSRKPALLLQHAHDGA